MITLNDITELTEKVIKRIVENHRMNDLPRLLELERYYNTDNNIKRRIMTDLSKPNNKIANSYASYITDTLTGYFIGEPITYNSNDKNIIKSDSNDIVSTSSKQNKRVNKKKKTQKNIDFIIEYHT